VVGYSLTGEKASRKAALEFLSNEGYDVGNSGSANSGSLTGRNSDRDKKSIWPARSNPQTDAERLQLQAEQDGIKTLTHPERTQVACRHLKQGWQPTWEWFEAQFGEDFKPDVTWTNLRNLVDYYEYDHIEVPDKPV
jgi:hypothetical protein